MKKILLLIIFFAFPSSVSAMEKKPPYHFDTSEYGFIQKKNAGEDIEDAIMGYSDMQHTFDEHNKAKRTETIGKSLRKKILALKEARKEAAGHVVEEEKKEKEAE